MITVAPDAAGLGHAVVCLRRGEVVAYPTETVYGLAVDPFSETALEALFALKGRDEGKPVLLIVENAAQASQLSRDLSAQARACMDAFWPGPLSLLLPAAEGLPARLTAGSGKVCVRCPACAIARDLCAAFGGPLSSTSANRAGMPPASSIAALDLPGLALAVDGGVLESSPPSTIFDPETAAILRAGAVSAASLARIHR